MVSTTDEPAPLLTAEEKTCDKQDEIKKMKEAICEEVDSGSGCEMEVLEGEGDKENGEKEPEQSHEPETTERPEESGKSPEGNAESTSSTATPSESGTVTLSENGASSNGTNATHEEPPKLNGASGDVECIDLDDDSDEKEQNGEPPSKKSRTEKEEPREQSREKSTPADEKKEKEPELNSPEALLNKLEEYVADAIENKKNVERKVLDALLGAINVQVQREPLSVRKLILDKQLVLPNTISFPPSLVVDMLIEHDPDHPLSKVVSKMFGEERPKLSDAEKKERQLLKAHNPAPHMTKLLMDIGQDLVQESTYCDIVHARNLPETPKNLETYKTVAAQLKPVWEALKKKNEPYKLKMLSCQVCGFKTESRLVLQQHRSRTHYKSGKYQCAMCPEFDTNEQRLLNHYLETHLVIATKDEPQAKYPCLICEEDFQFKGLRDQHMKVCKKDYSRVRHIMAPKGTEDHLTINRWLWDRPPIDPTILQQQQAAQAQQKKTQMQQSAALQAQQALRRSNVNNTAHAALLQQQMLQQQQRQQQQQQQQQLRQLGAMMSQQGRNLMGGNNLIAAMQQHLQRAAATANRTASSTSNGSNFYQKSMNAAVGNKSALLAAQAAALRKSTALGMNSSAMQKAMSAMAAASSTFGATPQQPPLTGSPSNGGAGGMACEICDQAVTDKEKYLAHLQMFHKQMRGKSIADMQQGAPLACSRCRDRFWTYEGLERHLVMSHGLVTADLLQKAQKKEDGGRCKLCAKQYAFNMLQHLVADHQVKLCSAEIMYSCDVCSFKCTSYRDLETHLSTVHPKNAEKEKTAENGVGDAAKKSGDDCITLDE